MFFLFFLTLLVSDFIYIYIHSTYNIQYRTKENKTIRKGPCKVKTIPDIKKNWIEITTYTHPSINRFFLKTNPRHRQKT